MSGFSSELLKSLKWTQMITGRLITACRALSKHTVTFGLPCQCISRCLLTSSSIFPIYCFRLSGFKNEISAPLTRLWSSPLSSIRFRSPRIILTEVVCWLAMVRLSLVNTNLFAACPEMKTVGLPNRLSFEIGPYFLTLSSSHCSAVLAFITRRRVRLWPMMGSPRDPGGSFCDDLVFLTRRKNMGMRNSRRRVRKGFMVERERSTD